MSKNVRVVVTVLVWLLAFAPFFFFRFDWPWDSLWTDPAAIGWTEVLTSMAGLVVATVITAVVWSQPITR